MRAADHVAAQDHRIGLVARSGDDQPIDGQLQPRVPDELGIALVRIAQIDGVPAARIPLRPVAGGSVVVVSQESVNPFGGR